MEPGLARRERLLGALLARGLSAARAVAGGSAVFVLANLLIELRIPSSSENGLWVDLGGIPPVWGQGFLFTVSLLWIAFALRPEAGRIRQVLTVVATGAVAAIAAANSLNFWMLQGKAVIQSDAALPFSLAVTGLLAALAWFVHAAPRLSDGRAHFTVAVLTAAALAVVFPVGQMHCYGKTDYRRNADLVVVFGARVYSNGEPSLALEDRTRTGCSLVLDGLADRIVFSGGPGDGPTHETEAMRDLALSLGVPRQAIVCDRTGLSTRHTIDAVRSMVPQGTRVLAVSHSYHLPRIKLAFQRAGITAYTVPSQETRPLARIGQFMAREVAAYWLYWARALVPAA